MTLAKYFIQQKRKLKVANKTCLELGAGCSGIPGTLSPHILPVLLCIDVLFFLNAHKKGTVLSMLGASKVFLTDVECVLPALKRNLQRNSSSLANCNSTYVGFVGDEDQEIEKDGNSHILVRQHRDSDPPHLHVCF